MPYNDVSVSDNNNLILELSLSITTAIDNKTYFFEDLFFFNGPINIGQLASPLLAYYLNEYNFIIDINLLYSHKDPGGTTQWTEAIFEGNLFKSLLDLLVCQLASSLVLIFFIEKLHNVHIKGT